MVEVHLMTGEHAISTRDLAELAQEGGRVRLVRLTKPVALTVAA